TTKKQIFPVKFQNKIIIPTRDYLLEFNGKICKRLSYYRPSSTDIYTDGFNMLSPTPEDDVLNSEGTVAGNAGMYVEKYKSQLLLGQINNIVTNYIYP